MESTTHLSQSKQVSNKASKLLISEPPLQVLPSLAVKIGLNEAIMLQQIHYWIINPFNQNIHEDKVWITKTHNDLKQNFPFWSVRTIRYVLKSLEKLGFLSSSSKINESWSDRSKAYTINYEVLDALDAPLTEQKLRPIKTTIYNKAHVAKFATCQEANFATSLLERNIKKYNNRKGSFNPPLDKPTEVEGAVVDEIRKMVGNLNISASQLTSWIATYGAEYVIAKIELMKGSEADSPERFLNSAIKLDWLPASLPLPPPQPEETSEMPHYTHAENAAWFEAWPEDEKKAIYDNAVLRDWRIKHHFKKANVTPLDEGFSDHWLFDYLMEQINRSQRRSLQDELANRDTSA